VEHPVAVERSPDALEDHLVAVERSPDAEERRDAAVRWPAAALSMPAGVVRVEGALEIRVSLQPLQAAPEPHGIQAE
jgi:hypothetical protein